VCVCVLQCVAVCCSVLQCVAVCCSVLQCVAVCCVLQCVSVRGAQVHVTSICQYLLQHCWVLRCVAVCRSVLQCVAVCCSVLQCVAVCCSVLQCVEVCCRIFLLVISSTSSPCVYVSFNWKNYIPEIHQIEKIGCLGISHYKFKLRFKFYLHSNRGIWVFKFLDLADLGSVAFSVESIIMHARQALLPRSHCVHLYTCTHTRECTNTHT